MEKQETPISCNQWALAAAVVAAASPTTPRTPRINPALRRIFCPFSLSSPSRWWLAIPLSLQPFLRHRHLLQFLYTSPPLLPALSPLARHPRAASSQLAVFAEKNTFSAEKARWFVASITLVSRRFPFPFRSPQFRLSLFLFFESVEQRSTIWFLWRRAYFQKREFNGGDADCKQREKKIKWWRIYCNLCCWESTESKLHIN